MYTWIIIIAFKGYNKMFGAGIQVHKPVKVHKCMKKVTSGSIQLHTISIFKKVLPQILFKKQHGHKEGIISQSFFHW